MTRSKCGTSGTSDNPSTQPRGSPTTLQCEAFSFHTLLDSWEMCLGFLNCWCLSIPVRTDCCFSPDDKLLITGTSVKKDEGNGKLAFFDRMSFEKVHEIEVTNAVSSASGFWSWFLWSCLYLKSVSHHFFWMESDLGEKIQSRGVWAKER